MPYPPPQRVATHGYREGRRIAGAMQRLAVQATRVVYNALVDVRFGGLLGGRRRTRFPERGAVDTVNSDYRALDTMFRDRIRADDILVDVGCGKGRVINWWLREGVTNSIVGVELDEEVADQTRKRLARYPNVRILAGDVLDLLPHAGTLFYLYNPFGEQAVAAFKQRLTATADPARDIRIIYNNCKHVGLFLADDDWDVEVVELGGSRAAPYDRAALMHYRPDPHPENTNVGQAGLEPATKGL